MRACMQLILTLITRRHSNAYKIKSVRFALSVVLLLLALGATAVWPTVETVSRLGLQMLQHSYRYAKKSDTLLAASAHRL